MKKSYFLSQPHQPFFVLAVIDAILFMALFALSFSGSITFVINPIEFHSYSLIFLVFTPSFLGFLLTTFTRFSGMPPLQQKEYLRVFYPFLIASLLFLVGSFSSIYLIYIAKLFILFAQTYAIFIFYNIYKASPSPDKNDQFWIMIAFFFGIVANLFSFFSLQLFSQTAIYLYLILLSFTIAQRMVPFFSHRMIEKNKNLLFYLMILLLLKVISESLELQIGFLFSLLAGILIAKEIIRWRLPNSLNEPILWILHLAIFMLPIGFIIGAFSSLAELLFDKNFIALESHLLLLGFLNTILIGFGTRVTLGHSGNQMKIDNYTKTLFYLTQIVVYFRVLYSLSSSEILYFISVGLFIALYLFWTLKYLSVLLYGKRLEN